MKKEIVKASEMIDGKRVFVAEGPLEIVESIEDILKLHENGLAEADVVTLFNASRRIEYQRQLKSKDGMAASIKREQVSKANALFSKAKNNPALEALLKENGLL